MVSEASMLETARPVVIAASLRVRVIAPVLRSSFPSWARGKPKA